MKLFEKSLKVYKEKGIKELFHCIYLKISQTIFYSYSAPWYTKYLGPKDIRIRIESVIPVTINYLEFNETLNWIKSQNVPWLLNEREKEVAIDEKHYWANLKYNGSIIGLIKIGFGDVYIPDYRKVIRFSRNVAFIYYTFILEDFRGRKVGSYFINETCTFLRRNGFVKVMCHISSGNKASIKAYLRVGFKMVKEVRGFTMLGAKIIRGKPNFS